MSLHDSVFPTTNTQAARLGISDIQSGAEGLKTNPISIAAHVRKGPHAWADSQGRPLLPYRQLGLRPGVMDWGVSSSNVDTRGHFHSLLLLLCALPVLHVPPYRLHHCSRTQTAQQCAGQHPQDACSSPTLPFATSMQSSHAWGVVQLCALHCFTAVMPPEIQLTAHALKLLASEARQNQVFQQTKQH